MAAESFRQKLMLQFFDKLVLGVIVMALGLVFRGWYDEKQAELTEVRAVSHVQSQLLLEERKRLLDEVRQYVRIAGHAVHEQHVDQKMLNSLIDLQFEIATVVANLGAMSGSKDALVIGSLPAQMSAIAGDLGESDWRAADAKLGNLRNRYPAFSDELREITISATARDMSHVGAGPPAGILERIRAGICSMAD